MKTKTFVVQVHPHSLVRYTGEVIVEAPEDMCEDYIPQTIWRRANQLPDPEWIKDDEIGNYTIYTDAADDPPEIIGLASSDAIPSVRLKEGHIGNIRVFVRKERAERSSFPYPFTSLRLKRTAPTPSGGRQRSLGRARPVISW